MKKIYIAKVNIFIINNTKTHLKLVKEDCFEKKKDSATFSICPFPLNQLC
jgi:hypothetical protein